MSAGTKCSHCEEVRHCRCSYADCPWDVDQANELLAVKDAKIARLQEQVETLRKAIAGKDRQMYPSVTHGQYLEMAATLHAAREGGIARAEALEAEQDRLREALIWYENNAAGCRLIHSGGDAHRAALAADGGNRARAALQKEPQP